MESEPRSLRNLILIVFFGLVLGGFLFLWAFDTGAFGRSAGTAGALFVIFELALMALVIRQLTRSPRNDQP